MDTPGHRLTAARRAAGYKHAKDAAKAMGVPIATYNLHEKAETHLPTRRAEDYARFYGLTPEFLLYGRGEAPVDRVPVQDACGQLTGATVAIPPPPSSLTLAVESDGVLAGYGMVALYDLPQGGRQALDLAGRLCVAAIEYDNVCHRMIRLVQPGSAPDRFHLISLDNKPPLIDHKVLWLAPVTALVPAP